MINLYVFNKSGKSAIYGIGTYIRELTNALKGNDINICIIHLCSEKSDMLIEEENGIRHWYIPAPIINSYIFSMNYEHFDNLYYKNIVYILRLYIKDVEKIVFQINHIIAGFSEELKKAFDCTIVDVIHYSNWMSALNGILSRLHSIKSMDSDCRNDSEKAVISTFEKEVNIYRNSDHVICLSQYMYEIMCNEYNINPSQITVIPNGLIDERRNRNKNILRAKWKLNIDERIILFVGRLDEVKGLIYLIRAFRKVLEILPECRLIVAGNGNFDPFMQESKDICTRVTYTGLLDKKNLYELYHIADIGVMPSIHETFGYVAVEMMMHNLPIVATATSGLNEVIDEHSGLKVQVIEYNDRVEIDHFLLAEKIFYLLQHPEERKKMGKNARKRYKKMYDSKVMRENMIRLYTSLLCQSEMQ